MRFDDLLDSDISPALFQYEKAERLSKRARILGKTGKIHIAVDTGMSRIGLIPNEESADIVKRIAVYRELRSPVFLLILPKQMRQIRGVQKNSWISIITF